jgi:small subunit ribosomal protein S16
MLAIRLQRVGRKGYPTYRLVVQESQRHPSSGRVVAHVGSYNPHTKDVTVKVEEVQKFLNNGAQPTPRVVKLIKDAGVVLPSWVVEPSADKQKTIRHSDKLRKNQPAPEAPEVIEEAVVTEEVAA